MTEMQSGMNLGSWERGYRIPVTDHRIFVFRLCYKYISYPCRNFSFNFGQKSHVLGHTALLISNGAFLTTVTAL